MWAYCEVFGDIGVRIREEGRDGCLVCLSERRLVHSTPGTGRASSRQLYIGLIFKIKKSFLNQSGQKTKKIIYSLIKAANNYDKLWVRNIPQVSLQYGFNRTI